MNHQLSESTPCTLTAIQVVSSENVDDNFQQIESQLKTLPAMQKGCYQLVLIPENALCFADRAQYLAIAETLNDGPNQTRLSELAKKYNCTLVCGSFPIKSEQPGKVHTTSLVLSAR